MEEKETKQQKSNNRAEEELLVPQNKKNYLKGGIWCKSEEMCSPKTL